MSGTEMQREKEKVAQKMREKQAAGTSWSHSLEFYVEPKGMLTIRSSRCEEGR